MSLKFKIVFGNLPSEKNLFGPAALLSLYIAIRQDPLGPCLASCPLWQMLQRNDVFSQWFLLFVYHIFHFYGEFKAKIKKIQKINVSKI